MLACLSIPGRWLSSIGDGASPSFKSHVNFEELRVLLAYYHVAL